MKRRFVPTPYDALALCSSGRERLAVLGLYERAHAYGWGALKMSVRQFAELGDLRSESALHLLEDLERAGLLRREASPSRSASFITVFDPTIDTPTQVEHRSGGPAEHQAEHNGYGTSSETREERNTERNTTGTPPRNTSHARSRHARAEPDQTRQTSVVAKNARATPGDVKPAFPSSHPPGPSPVMPSSRADQIEPVREAFERIHGRPMPMQDAQAVIASDLTGMRIALLLDWQATCPSEAATFARSKRWALKSLIKAGPALQDRLADAEAWDAAGRPLQAATGPPARAAPTQPASRAPKQSFLDRLRNIPLDDEDPT
jgi:hypothetical protein